MSYPTVEIGKKRIILLSGFEKRHDANKPPAITAKKQLEEATKRHRDAVAFGYVSGMWLPAAYMRDCRDGAQIQSKAITPTPSPITTSPRKNQEAIRRPTVSSE
jgi:hypothetical protein